MEDAQYCSYSKENSMALFCVFDGHAGKDCSNKLTRLFPKIFVSKWKDFPKNNIDLSPVWLDVYKDVDNSLKEFEYQGSTSTTVFLWKSLTNKKYVQCANLGDSLAFLCRAGNAIELTQEHKPTNPSEKDRLLSMGVELEQHQSRLNGLSVSRAFGDFFPKENGVGMISVPYISALYELSPKDTHVIIASDGLWDVMTGQHACDLIKKSKSASESAEKLLKTALNSPKCRDNVTVIVVHL